MMPTKRPRAQPSFPSLVRMAATEVNCSRFTIIAAIRAGDFHGTPLRYRIGLAFMRHNYFLPRLQRLDLERREQWAQARERVREEREFQRNRREVRRTMKATCALLGPLVGVQPTKAEKRALAQLRGAR